MGVLDLMFEALAREADMEWAMIDSTIVRVHQHAAGAQKRRRDPSDQTQKFKQFRAIGMRYDKTAPNFLAAIHLASAVIWLN